MQRIPWLDPLRGVAAALVLVSHVAYWSGGSSVDGAGRLLARGDVGVACFFAVSAYLLTRAASAGRPLSTHYWRKRAARIMPIYLVVLAAVVTVAAVTNPDEVTVRAVLSHVLLVQGWANASFRGFTQAWSITTEVTFYLLVPLVARWLRSCARRGRSALPALAAVAAAGLVVQALSASSGHPETGVVSTSILGHAAWFAVGIAVGWAQAHPTTPCARPRVGELLGWAGVVYVAAATPLGGPIHLETPSLAQALAKEALYAAFAGLVLVAVLRAPAPQRADVAGAARAAGDVSYGVFLWHILVLEVLFTTLHLPLFHTSFVLVLVVTGVVSLALARAGWLLVEAPAIRWAHRPPRERRAPAPPR